MVDQPEPSVHATKIPSVSKRSAVYALVAVAVVHSLIIMVWVMPVNPFRDALGQQRVASYINPYFEQSWSVFAPTPRRGGENVVIRAFVGKPGSKTGHLTEWFDITADEDQRIKYLVNPSRFHSATRRLGGNVNAAMAKFSVTQKRLVAANFVTTPRSELDKYLNKVNRLGDAGKLNIIGYLRNDEMLTRYGTMYATARWGKGVSLVQFRVGHRTVPNYSKRNEINFRDVPFTYYLVGWRQAMPGNRDAQAAFDGYVKKAPAAKRGSNSVKPSESTPKGKN